MKKRLIPVVFVAAFLAACGQSSSPKFYQVTDPKLPDRPAFWVETWNQSGEAVMKKPWLSGFVVTPASGVPPNAWTECASGEFLVWNDGTMGSLSQQVSKVACEDIGLKATDPLELLVCPTPPERGLCGPGHVITPLPKP